jgi:hypothetical protein
MKKIMLEALACTCFVLGASSASRAQTIGLRVNIPFDFNVAERVLPAGHYLIQAPRRDKLEILGPNGSATLAITNEISGKRPEGPGAVVFNCYKDRCFLAQFWTVRTDTGQEVLISRLERELAAQRQESSMITLRATPCEQKKGDAVKTWQ